MARSAAQQKKTAPPDLSALPPASVRHSQRWVCLACIFDIFTRQLKLAPRTAYTAVRGHEPNVAELTGLPPMRPYFDTDEERFPRCPYCDSTKGKLAKFPVTRLEGSRATAAARKKIIESLPKETLVIEEKASRRELLFEWLAELGRSFDFDQSDWLIKAARSFLEKRDPKTDWEPVFAIVREVRRSHRLEEGWEREGTRLYLAPGLFDEVLLMQYLVSRSHKSGGVTFEGRLTLSDLMKRLRRRGFLAEHEVSGEDPAEFLEKLVDSLDSGQSASLTVYYLVDRRDFLEKTKSVYAKYSS